MEILKVKEWLQKEKINFEQIYFLKGLVQRIQKQTSGSRIYSDETFNISFRINKGK